MKKKYCFSFFQLEKLRMAKTKDNQLDSTAARYEERLVELHSVIAELSRLGGVHKLRLQNLAFFDHLPPSVYIFYGMKVYKKSIFLTTYPPPLVSVVCERPLSTSFCY